MKIRWWITLLLIIGLIIGPVIKTIPGFVIIALNQTTMQFPLWLAVAVSVLIIVITGILIVLMGQFIQAAARAKNWSRSRKWKKARKETISGMLMFSEGNWELSEKKMIAAAGYGDTKLINYLIAAQAAQKQLAFEKRDEYLRRAKKVSPEADVAIGLTQARLQIESEQYEEALAVLLFLLKAAPKNKYVSKLFVEVNVKLKKWSIVLTKIHLIEKQKIYSEKEWLAIKRKAICGIMLGDYQREQWSQLQNFWNEQTRKTKKDPVLLLEYVAMMHSFGKDIEVEPVLKKLLRKRPTRKALKLYAKLHTKTPGKQLDFVESLEINKEIERDYYEVLSELANMAELWGKSRDYLQKSLRIADTVKTRAALANVFIKLGEVGLAQVEREQAVKLLEQGSKTIN